MKPDVASHNKLSACLLALIALCSCCFTAATYPEEERTPGASSGEAVLTFGVYAHVRSTEVHKKFSSIRRYIEQSLAQLGIHKRVHLKIYSSYPQAIDALANGEVDFVRYGPVSYIQSKKKNQNIRLLAMESNAGKKTFNGVIAVPVDSPVHSLEDLRGRRLAFGGRSSTTGRYLSQAALVEAGFTQKDFAEVAYLGRHDKVAFAVASGNYAAGAMNENTFNKYKEEKGLRSILQFDCVTKPWAAREGLDASIYDALRQILLELDTPELLKPLKRDGLLPADDSEYDGIRQAMRLARQFDEMQLVFGTYASQRPADVFSTIRPVLDVIESKLDIDGFHLRFDVRVFPTYTEGIDSIANDVVDIARLGVASYVMASDRQPGLTILVQEDSGPARVEGVFVVRKDSPVTTLQGLRGRTLAFANKHSTAGRYLSQAILVREGITGSTLRGFSYLGRHDKVAFAVAAGNYDAGVLRSTVFERTGMDNQLRPVMRFSIPEKLWVARQGLKDDLVILLREVFTSLDNHPAQQGLGLSGFVYPPVLDYEQIRKEMALSLEFWSGR
jgi:phosphonate transport system substrate-binding protein